MIWLIIILIISILLGWFLLAPFKICINSSTNDYYLKWKGIGEIRVIVLPNDLLFHLKFAFWEKDYSIMEFNFKSKKPDPEKDGRKKAPKRINFTKNGRRFKHILKSFTVQKFRLNLDTQNYILNGYLFPIFFHLSRFYNNTPSLTINYQGKSEVNLQLQNRLINIFFALIR